ncbi:phage tail assembly protein [Xenorhabdus sp. DI]|uniref:phage tail assembly protein n=1 Tax=Xenorhabdus doucetiae TaxID=351671 RepID=UPI0019B4184E|nr:MULTISPECIES: phage tail assembly protein [unclassified Xenorhabdus]MBD2783685.1 phage tail assembly protein [Xenorhabdus sp. 3]MBD2789864.1 phage tail assembly protein [Xenorhabdus sp. DI]
MSKSITFSAPMNLANGKTITEVEITDTMKQVGALRGLKLWDVMTSDVNALITLLPRVTHPRLSEADVATMPVQDFTLLAEAIATFLAPTSPASETNEPDDK